MYLLSWSLVAELNTPGVCVEIIVKRDRTTHIPHFIVNKFSTPAAVLTSNLGVVCELHETITNVLFTVKKFFELVENCSQYPPEPINGTVSNTDKLAIVQAVLKELKKGNVIAQDAAAAFKVAVDTNTHFAHDNYFTKPKGL